jgi:hypothetical protein
MCFNVDLPYNEALFLGGFGLVDMHLHFECFGQLLYRKIQLCHHFDGWIAGLFEIYISGLL